MSGCKTDKSCGAGFVLSSYGYDIHSEDPMKAHSSFSAKSSLSKKSLKRLLHCDIHNTSIAICADSKASLKALDSPLIYSKLILECFEALQIIGCTNVFFWVP